MRKINGYEMYYTNHNNFHLKKTYKGYGVYISNLWYLKGVCQIRSFNGDRILGYCTFDYLDSYIKNLDTLYTFNFI